MPWAKNVLFAFFLAGMRANDLRCFAGCRKTTATARPLVGKRINHRIGPEPERIG